jgi:hypothetical protein
LPYINQLGPGLVKQGDLTDPYYFDFISFSQYATIFRDVSINPSLIFQEQEAIVDDANPDSPQQFVTRVVQRRPEWSNNALLPTIHDQLVGEAILNYFIQVFGDTTSAIPSLGLFVSSNELINETRGSKPVATSSQILASLQQLANLFVISGFAWDRNVIMVPNKNPVFTTIQVKFIHPATLWSGQALQLKHAYPTNDFYRKAAVALLTRAGLSVLNWKVEYSNEYDELTTITSSFLNTV